MKPATVLRQNFSFSSERRRREIPVAERIERLSLEELQKHWSSFLRQRLADFTIQERVIKVLQDIWERRLHLRNPQSGEKKPVNISLVPVIISPEVEERIRLATAVTNLVRAAILLLMKENKNLYRFLAAGVHPLALEIMEASDFSPSKAQWRWRGDTQTSIFAPDFLKWIENNGGEPQGDGIISYAVQAMKKVLSICFNLEEDELRIAPYPEEQMIRVMMARYRILTGSTALPVIGYQAWKGRDSLSGVEAEYSASTYRSRFGGEGVAFSPHEIEDIIKVDGERGTYYRLIVNTHQGERVGIDIIRRLLGEPFENLEEWEKFKNRASQTLCSDGEETIWERYLKMQQEQMINPLFSWPTDKKLDVIMGNPQALDYFGVWRKVEEILNDEDLCYRLSLPRAVLDLGLAGIKSLVREAIPRAYILRRKGEGLYPEAEDKDTLCLTEEEIEQIKQNPFRYVLKRYSLVGHSGTSVHLGGEVQFWEMELEDYLALPDDSFFELTGMGKEEFRQDWERNSSALRTEIAKRVERGIITNPRELQRVVWSVLIDNSLKRYDCLVQERTPTYKTDAILYDPSERDFVALPLHYDLDPQSVGVGSYTWLVVRVSSFTKTNISGGYGGLGVPISTELVKRLLQIAIEKGLYEL